MSKNDTKINDVRNFANIVVAMAAHKDAMFVANWNKAAKFIEFQETYSKETITRWSEKMYLLIITIIHNKWTQVSVLKENQS